MRDNNPNVNICTRKGITLVELVVSISLVMLFSVVCISLINPIERIYQHTVKLSRAQLVVDTVVDAIRNECDDVDYSDEGSVWIANGTKDADDSSLFQGPVDGVYVNPSNSGHVLVMRKNGNYCEAIFSCFRITNDNIQAVKDTGMTGTSYSHAANSLLGDSNANNRKSGYVHFGYYQAKDNNKGVTPYKAYDYTNPLTASAYDGYSVSLSFERLKYKTDENGVKHPTFVECVISVYEGDYSDVESKRIYTRSTVISFSPNGSGKGTTSGGGNTPSSKKNIDVRVRWVDKSGNAIPWPEASEVPSIDISFNGSSPVRKYTLANGLSRFVFANVEVSGDQTLTCSVVDGYTYSYIGSADNGFVVTYKQDDVNTVKLVCGKQFSSKFIGSGDQKKITGIVFGKKSDWENTINNFKANGAIVTGPTPVAVPYNDPSESENYKDDYVLYKVTRGGQMTVYVLSKNGRFVLNDSCEKMFINIEKLESITGFTGPEDVNTIFSTELTTSMRCMFEGCKKISTFELAGLVSSKVTNTYGMFKNCTGVVRYDFSGWDTSGITNMSYMFNNFQMTNQVFTVDISNFRFNQTQNIDMSHMFDSCGATNIVFPSSISDTAGKVSTIECMFQNCTKLKSIDGFMINAESSDAASDANVKELKFGGATNANSLFYGCASLKNVRLWISLPSCTYVETFFNKCANLHSADLSKSDFSGLTSFKNFFNECGALETVKLNNNFLLSSMVTNNTTMFEKCSNLKHLEMKECDLRSLKNAIFFIRDSLEYLDLSGAKLWSITSCENFFKVINSNNEKHLISIDMTDTELNNSSSYKNMFKDCHYLTTVKFSPKSSSSVTSIDCTGMFRNCYALTSINLSEWDKSKVSNMSYLFENCTGLATFVFNNITLDKCTTVEGMFSGCTELATVQMSGITAPVLKNCSKLFQDCSKLDVDVGAFDGWNMTSVTNMSYIFKGCSSMGKKSSGVISLSGMNLGECTTLKGAFEGCVLMSKLMLNDMTLTKCSDFTDLFKDCTDLIEIQIQNSDLTGASSLDFLKVVPALYLSGSTFGVTSLENTFSEANGSVVVTIDMSNVNLSKCTTAKKMFSGSKKLETVTLDGLSAPKLTDCSFMFENTGFENYTFTNVNLGACTTMEGMFSDCKKLTTVDMSGLSTPVLKNCSCLFQNCTKLDIGAGNFAGWNMSSVTDMSYIFKGCSNMGKSSSGEISLSGKNLGSCTTMAGAFEGCILMTKLKLNNMTLTKCSDYTDLFNGCNDLIEIQIQNSDLTGASSLDFLKVVPTLYLSGSTFGVTTLESAFSETSGSLVETLDMRNVTLPKCTTAKKMFSGSTKLITIMLDGLVAPELTDCSYMFENTGFETYSLNNVIMNKCTTIEGIFSGCNNLTSVDMSGLTTPKLTNCSYIFKDCSSLGSGSNGVISLSGMNLGACTTMQGAFEGCTLMTVLRLDNMTLTKCNTYTDLYKDCPQFTSIEITNSDLKGIKNLGFLFDARNIDLSGSTLSFSKLESTFQNNNVIETFILNGTHFPNCISFLKMFIGCTKLTKVEMVGLDSPVLNNCSSMFMNCSALKTLDMSGCDTSSVTNMSYMFSGCSDLKTLDMNGCNTSSVTNMSYLCSGCYVLSFDSSGWDGWNTSNVTNMSYMFKDCCYDYHKTNSANLRNADFYINISNFNFSSVTNMTYMFSCGTSKDNKDWNYDILDTIILPDGTNDNGNAPNVTNTMYMFMWRHNTTEIRNLEHFKTSDNLKYARSMFSRVACSVLDVSGINFSKLENSDNGSAWIFDNCEELTTIYAAPDTDYKLSATYAGKGMFNNSTKLVGVDVNGVQPNFSYNSKYVDRNYARVCSAGKDGYFTAKTGG